MLRAILLAVFGTVFFAVVYATMGPIAPREAKSPGPAPVLAELRPAATPAVATASDGVAVTRNVRDVTPLNITAGAAASGPLIRIPAPSARAEPGRLQAPGMERLYHPLVTAAGILKAGGREIRLAGIVAPGFAARCGDAAAIWPCGRMARAALRRFIRGRAIECEVPAGADAIPEAASCSVAGQDLSGWLVAQGWAAQNEDRLAELEAKARRQKLGLWGAGRSGGQLGELAASDPDSALAISERVSSMP